MSAFLHTYVIRFYEIELLISNSFSCFLVCQASLLTYSKMHVDIIAMKVITPLNILDEHPDTSNHLWRASPPLQLRVQSFKI